MFKLMKLVLHDPAVVSRAPPDIRSWGPWQFPRLQRLEDGRLLLEFHKEADSAAAYGLPPGQAVSEDDGATWRNAPPTGIQAGLRLPNSDLLRACQRPSPPAAGRNMPKPLAHVQSSYNNTYTYYRRSELPEELRAGWWFRRKPAGSSTWVEEQASVETPDDIAYVTEGVFVFPYFEQDRIHVAPDGRLVATLYGLPQMNAGRILVRRFLAMLVESPDNGRTWRLKGIIPYCPDTRSDPIWDARDGFTEPQIAFLPNDSMLALLRTTDGNGIGPLYSTRSRDGGKTWDSPRVFDNMGVWPQALVLKCGVTLAAYGRPGLFIRATDDPAAKKWDKKITVVPAGQLHADTCSYSDMIALNDREALIAYSDFNAPDSNGRPCKTILIRRIEVR